MRIKKLHVHDPPIKRILSLDFRRNLFTTGILLISIFCIDGLGDTIFSCVYAQNKEIKDREIAFAVEMELLNDEAVPAHLINAEANNGIITLSGSVDNLLARDRASRIAETVKGVRSVINTISVTPVTRSDTQIIIDVEKALAIDPVTDFYEIDTKVDKGVVVLYSTVESWAEKQLAEQVVKGVQGVKGVRNEMMIDYRKQRPDSEIKADIKGRLSSDVYIDDMLLDVVVKDGKVTLHGTVGSAAEKSRVFYDAWVSGVTAVDNSELEVKWWMRDELRRKVKYVDKSDEEIKKAVEDTFFYDPRVASFNIHIEVKDGVVILSGMVDNLHAKKVAEQDAKNTIGMRVVKNFLKVRPGKLPTNLTAMRDPAIVENVHDALSRNPITDRLDITVELQNKKVYLYGGVNTFYEKRLAEDVVSRVPGVIDVVNKLEVNYRWPWKSDEEIKNDIESQWYWDVFINSDDISVKVHNGVATIYGIVDNQKDSLAVVKDAFDGGAKIVRSFLEFRGNEKGEQKHTRDKTPRYYYPEYFYDFYSSPYYIIPRV
ncbi:MAG: BON domain-containing protein [Candidatus Jettenia sp. CY-1]|nr:MAG: BON domain-containing protein [Candidatus Jettenia sp. CY-1]